MALSALSPWHYFDRDDQADALTALRARMGSYYTTSVINDAALLDVLALAVETLHVETGRFFVERTGSVLVDGTGGPTLWLPYPVISTTQGGDGVTAVAVSGEELGADTYVVIDGAEPRPNDPRDNPRIELEPVGGGYSPTARGYWPEGTRNVSVAGSFGYVAEDGATPGGVLQALALLCVWFAEGNDDPDARDERRRGMIISESTQGRSWALAAGATGGGYTGDREIDRLLKRYKRPVEARVYRGDKSRRRRRRHPLA